MAHHQLADGKRRQLDLRRRTQDLVRRGGQLVHVHPAVDLAPRIPYHPAVHL